MRLALKLGCHEQRTLDEESKARVLAPTLLCDLWLAADISEPQNEGKKRLGSSSLCRKWRKGQGAWSQVFFSFFSFQHKGLE